MDIKFFKESIQLWNIVLTALTTTFITLIGIKMMVKRIKNKEKYMILKKRGVSSFMGKDIYELTDNEKIKSLINENEILKKDMANLKKEHTDLKKEYKYFSLKAILIIITISVSHKFLKLFKRQSN